MPIANSVPRAFVPLRLLRNNRTNTSVRAYRRAPGPLRVEGHQLTVHHGVLGQANAGILEGLDKLPIAALIPDPTRVDFGIFAGPRGVVEKLVDKLGRRR